MPDDAEGSSKLTVSDMKLTVKDGAQWTPTAIASTDTTAQTGQKDTPLNNLVLDNGIVNVKDETVQEDRAAVGFRHGSPRHGSHR